ncbi:MAG: NAD(P)/FAD-dependent oxidoreductase [Bacteroidales bacterium]|nr:NAD(P)/FAD-dependent oxidoreductase [Bacteroidales bacterium]
MNNSAVIIGGGLGGLFTGAILAKEGWTVCVLEKNAVIGGGLQSFRRFGELFDTGMHVVGGMQRGGNVRRLCEYLGIWDKVQVRDADPEQSDSLFVAEDNKTYRIARGRNGFIDSLCRDFPGQREALGAYVDALYRIADEVAMFRLRPETAASQTHSEAFYMPASELIAKYIEDARLRSVLAYLNPLYGGRAEVTPAYVHAVVSVLYMGGASHFAGGSVLFAESLRACIEANGGRVLAGDAVTAVHSEGKQITGVSTASGKQYAADCYVCAIHPCTFLSLLDDESILPRPYRERLRELPNACSAFTLNIKFRAGTFPFSRTTMHYVSRYDKIWQVGEARQWPCGFVCVTPPELVQGDYAGKMIVTVPMPWEAVSRWEHTVSGQRGADYVAWKAVQAEKVLSCLADMFPGIRDCIEAVDTASPLTIRDFYGVKDGSMYGFVKDCRNPLLSQVPVVTKVPNLFLTGQNCNLHGFCGVSLTAVSTCEAILGSHCILDKLNRFDDIRPYYDAEIPAAMHRMAHHPSLGKVMDYLFPDGDVAAMQAQLETIRTVDEFQTKIMYPVLNRVFEKTCPEYACAGLEDLDPAQHYLFVSNHRDIMLDATLLTWSLYVHGFDTPEITFGANLMQDDFVVDVGRVNKMFRVERPGSDMRAFYHMSEHLSDYIRTTVGQKCQSVWIAQRNGRTKDGTDRTDQGIIKMFAMSGPADRVRAIADLHIVPVAISYEWEPCDLLKAVELYKRAAGPYRKQPGEDLHSILTGVTQQKGRIRLQVCPPLREAELRAFGPLTANHFYKQVATLIDSRICAAYHLHPNNYIAHDLLSGNGTFRSQYTDAQKERFEAYVAQQLQALPAEGKTAIYRLLLGIYAHPVDSRDLFAAA